MTTTRTFHLSTLAFFFACLSPAIAGTFTFSNTNAIIINDSVSPPTTASPYPSTNLVTGLDGAIITKVTVHLSGFVHTFPSDVDIVLVGPAGQNAVLMGNTGGENRLPVTNVDLTLDDDAETSLPADTELVSGTFKPTQTRAFLFDFPAPAPLTSQLMGPTLTNFINTGANGTWSLFVVDDSSDDSGVITGGWSLTITTVPVFLSIAQQQTNAILSWTNTAPGFTLQSTPSLSPPAWTNITSTPALVGNFYTVTNPITTNRTFYRLAK